MSDDVSGSELLLELTGVSKKFSGTTVLHEVEFGVREGEIHALMGENGAGKSTLMKIVGGVHRHDTGTVRVAGKLREFSGPADAIQAGVAMIHQELSTVPYMTVAENLVLGQEPTRAGFIVDRPALVSEARRKLDRIGVSIDPKRNMGDLSIAYQQMVEIARAIDQEARLLILDEPTAALSDSESERLFDLLKTMRSEGMGLIYISHRLDEVWRLADRITVLRDGRLVSTSEREVINQDDVVRQMVGRRVERLYVRNDRTPGDVALEVNGLTSKANGIGPVSFTVRAGEVVTLVGLIGAGRTETVRLVYGADRADSGTVRLNGKEVSLRSVPEAISHGIGMLPENRKEQALFLYRDVADNIAISSLSKHTSWGMVSNSLIAKTAQKFISDLNIRARSHKQVVSTLSGGNQQKVVLARLLSASPEILVLDEPTRGVDVGAKREIYEIINALTTSGRPVLTVSSDLPEALGISDRLLVFHEGKLVKELNAEDSTEEDIMMYATGLREG